MNLNEDKFGFGLFSLVVIVAAWFTTYKFPAIGANFPTLVAGVTGIYTIFAGAHVANNWVNTPTQPNITTTTTTGATSTTAGSTVKVSESPPPASTVPTLPVTAPAPVVKVPELPTVVPPPVAPLPEVNSPTLPAVPQSLAKIASALGKLAEKKRKKN